MDPSHPDFSNFIVQNVIIDDIIEEDERREFAAFAALLTLVKNQQESSEDDYDSEYDYESATGSKSHEEEQESVIPERALDRPVVRKRTHSELNSRAPPPAKAPPPPPPANKRVRIEGIPPSPAPQPSNPQPTVTDIKGTPQQAQILYSPDEAIRKINPKPEASASVCGTAIAEIKVRYGGMPMEKAQAIVSTRFLNDAHAAQKYVALKESAKESYFNQLFREGLNKPWVPAAVPKDGGGGANPPQVQMQMQMQAKQQEQEQAKPAAPAPKREQLQPTKLRSDILKQVDARSQGKLEDRVRLWLDNVIPN